MSRRAADLRALVAVSGGLDSMVLLHELVATTPKPAEQVVVAHFNHQLRGRSSDADERFVRLAAQKLGVRCIVGRGDVRARAKREKISIEMAARAERHEFLARTARELGIRRIALAHHADDQVELFFLRLLRGASVGGLAGMQRESPSPVDPNLKLHRPLLNATKAQLREFALAQRIRHREDASNARPEFLRNRIRRELLPLMRRLQPAIDRIVPRVMEIMADEAMLVRLLGMSQVLRPRAGSFAKLNPALQRAAIELQLLRLDLEPSFERIEQLRLHSEKPVMVSPNCRIRRNERGILHQEDFRPLEFRSGSVLIELVDGSDAPSAEPVAANFAGLDFRAELVSATAARRGLARRWEGVEVFDANKIGPRLTLRHWRAGDRFQPIGMKQSVKLQDWFVNRKISAELRRSLVVAEAADGVLCWVEGERIGELFKLDSGTKRGLKWEWSRKLALG